MRKSLILDRDGVVNIDNHHVYKKNDFQFLAGILDVCDEFAKNGFLIFIITNQAGIARGLYSEIEYFRLTRWMLSEFLKNGINIQKVYHCPHHPDFTGDCSCRKPKPGMILEAQSEYDLDLHKSVLIGDKESDIQAGQRAGVGNNIMFNESWEKTNIKLRETFSWYTII